MSDLTAFLLARIAEDEAAVTAGALGADTSYSGWHTVECGTGLGYWALDTCTCRYVDRVLAECEAKRRIIAEHKPDDDDGRCVTCVHYTFREDEDAPCLTLRLLALPYAGHPDYREEWRP